MNPNYSPKIETFPRRVGSSHTIIGVDIQLEAQIPLEKLPWVNALRVSALGSPKDGPTETGGDDGEPSEHFPARTGFEIEEQLFMPLVTGNPKNAVLVGSVSTLRSAEWFVYSAEPLAERFEAAILEQFPELEINARAQHDPDWSVYREFLCPSQIERLLIQNRRKVREMDQVGDDDQGGDKLRIVDHTVWFTSPDDRNAFAEIVTDRGFELHYPEQNVELETTEEDIEYGLTITREEHLDIETMDELIRWLFKFASRFAGEYEGWHVQH